MNRLVAIMLATFSFFAFLTLSSGLLILRTRTTKTNIISVSANLRQCYNCGYKKDNNATETHEIEDLPFCGDFANPMDNLVNCTAEADCCAVMKEFFEMYFRDRGIVCLLKLFHLV